MNDKEKIFSEMIKKLPSDQQKIIKKLQHILEKDKDELSRERLIKEYQESQNEKYRKMLDELAKLYRI